ncbi:putative rnd superfamily protein [Klebsiella grimontii]|uniref:Putative rnd superfamily protein n=1 Tax=Klebsiella grimontii TaxID=2058152 RepID=A0A7H4P3W0_9ENTR|nr:putative rnd superfamily protein [Klebsiella grimontii]
MVAAYPRDSTPFVTVSIESVVHTLIEAILFVVAVMYLFLQSWRATLIPTLTVPVVLLGTFGILSLLGYSINTLTLFAMVLAIGLLVDDAIVVVENVERLMAEEDLTPLEATLRSMNEITGALIGIALVLSAVFIPMALFGGSVGIIYRQFTVTIVSAMALSALVALTLTPTLCAHLLKPGHMKKGRFFTLFNRGVTISQNRYLATLQRITARPFRFVCLALILTFFDALAISEAR